MTKALLLPIAIVALTFTKVAIATDNGNATRVEDWDTLLALSKAKVPEVAIEADSTEALSEQLDGLVRAAGLGERIRFNFDRTQEEAGNPDGAAVKQKHAALALTLVIMEEIDLLTIVRYVSELGGMTFDVKKGEIAFRLKFC